jgi:hypothetical protein
LQGLDPAIGNVGQRKVEALQLLQICQPLDVVVGRPGAGKRHLDDVPIGGAHYAAALRLDPPRQGGIRQIGRGEHPGSDQRDQSGFHRFS